jgi:hypothetical protein
MTPLRTLAAFWQLYALADAVIASAVIENSNRQRLHVSAVKAGDSISGVFTSVTLASGKIARL